MGEVDPTEFAYYILTAEPEVCPDCEALDGTMFLKDRLAEFEGKLDQCAKGCFIAIVGVYNDEVGALETARRIAAAGGILKEGGG